MQLALDFRVHSVSNEMPVSEQVGSVALKEIFRKAYGFYRGRSRKDIVIEDFHIRFFRYSGLKHTLRINHHLAEIRLSEWSRNENVDFFEALAHILWSKIFSMKCPPHFQQKYRQRERLLMEQIPAGQGKKIILPPQGRVYDLQTIMENLIRMYFSMEKFRDVAIGWSRQKAIRRLGHYDGTAKTIVLSAALDHAAVPPFVVESIVYHEMLHHLHPVEFKNGRHVIHGDAFKKMEEVFPCMGEAETWLKQSFPGFVRRRQRNRWVN